MTRRTGTTVGVEDVVGRGVDEAADTRGLCRRREIAAADRVDAVEDALVGEPLLGQAHRVEDDLRRPRPPAASDADSVASPRTASTPLGSTAAARLGSRTSARTSSPRSSRAEGIALPTLPVAPVTRATPSILCSILASAGTNTAAGADRR